MLKCSFLYFGDIVGHQGRDFLQQKLPDLKSKYKPDFIFANAENAANGFGLTAEIADEIYKLGINGMTLGNHTWNRKGFWEEIDTISYVCRPANFPLCCPGNRYLIFDFHGKKLAIINLIGRNFINISADCPFTVCKSICEDLKKQGIEDFVIDFHAETTSEKYALGWFLSELNVSAVVGTHTHVQTADERIINGQTAFLCDLGMCGPQNGILGCERKSIINRFISSKPCRFEVAAGDMMINGASIVIDMSNHKAVSIERIHIFS